MTPDSDAGSVITLPDGTTCRIDVANDEIVYEVVPADDGRCQQANYYGPEDARRQAREIREREAASWDTVFPEQAGPVLDVADALEQAAAAVEEA